MNRPPSIRVLVVDDSAFARKLLQEMLASDPALQVIGIAHDGLEAVEKIQQLQPDVVTLDLMMPNLDGVGVLRALPAEQRARVVVVSISPADSERGVEALQLGAFDLVQKPTALATNRLYEMQEALLTSVRACAAALRARRPGAAGAPAVAPAVAPVPRLTRFKVVVIGTSTGGPQALTRLLTTIPAAFPVPIAVALHIPAGYTEALARRINDGAAIEVREASDGLELRPGLALIARGGIHLKIRRQGSKALARLDPDPLTALHRPSVDTLFSSAVETFGGDVLGMVLTGMGDDGLVGSRKIREAGGVVLTEAESTCVVYGMPRAVHEAGLSTAEAPLDGLGPALLRLL